MRGLFTVAIAMIMVFAGIALIATEADADQVVADQSSFMSAINDDSTSVIVLGNNVTLDDVTIDKSITINGNGVYKITISGVVKVMGTAESISFNNVVFDGSGYMQIFSKDVSMSGCSYVGEGKYALNIPRPIADTDHTYTFSNTNFNGKKITFMNATVEPNSSREVTFVNCENVYLKVAIDGVKFIDSDEDADKKQTSIIMDEDTNISTIELESSPLNLNGNEVTVDVLEIDTNANSAVLPSVKNGSLNANLICGTEGVVLEVSDIEMVGSIEDINVKVTSGVYSIPMDSELSLAEGSELILSSNTTLKVAGNIIGDGTISTVSEAENAVIEVANSESIKVTVPEGIVKDMVPAVSATASQFQEDVNKYPVVKVDGEITISSEEIVVPEGRVIILNGIIRITSPSDIGADRGLFINGSTVEGSGIIIVESNANLYLDGADVRVSVIVEENAYVGIKNAKEMSVSGNQTADLGVGYGNTLVLKDLDIPAGKNVQAWGTVIVEGTVTVEDGAEFNVYAGGNAQIDGALVIEGDAEIEGDMDIVGSVKVYNADGGATFTTGETSYQYNDGNTPKTGRFIPEVKVSGTMDVLKEKTKGAPTNELNAVSPIIVEGTLTVTGKLAGKVCDMGTIVFNGVADNATIAVYDGVTLTITAVDGKLILTDDGIVDTTDMNYDYMLSDGNTVTIEDVKNVTVSVEVVETVKEKVRYIYTNMDVSGVITDIEENEKNADIDAKVGIANTSDISKGSQLDAGDVWPSTIPMCAITIGDITLGKDTQLTIDAVNATVKGTVNVVADGSGIITSKVVDVEGTIIVAGDDANLKVNGAMYVIDDITDDKDPITYYTTFENAIAAVATAYDNEVTILGEVEVATAVDIPAEATVLVKGTLTIDVDGKITVAVDAVFNATEATKNVDIDGMLVIMDKEYGLEGENKLTYQVYTETETTATYSGLVLAIQNAVAGDVITLKQNADITKSVTIPEGVTLVVPNNVDLFIGDKDDKVTLTVAGKLEVQNGGEVRKALTSSTTDPAETTVSTEVTISISGVVTMATDGSVPDALMDDYVEFTMKVDGKDVHVHSNLAYAAENAVNRDVTIKGDVSGGDVTFTYDGKIQALAIKVPVNSTLTVGTLTIVGDGASIQAVQATAGSNDEDGTITGTIATAAGSVDLNKVSGITLTVIIEEDVDGTTDVVTIAGEPVGSVDIASGTVTATTGFKMNATKDNKMSVASGATLVIDSTNVAINGTKADKVYAIVDGTISIVKGGIATISYTTVNGNVDVASAGQLTVGTDSVITGTITVAEKTDDAVAGIANIASNLFVGTAPAIGATGTLVGPFTTADADNDTSNVIIAYPGSDLTGALIDVGTDGKSAAKSTEFYINGQLYMTAITAEGIAINTFANGLGIEIPGLDTPKNVAGTADEIKWFTDEALKTPVTDSTKIGDSEKLYAEFAASEVDLVVSAGVGLQVYIDGLAVANFDGKITVGTHTVSFAVESGYDGSNATITVNGVAVSNNGTFTVDVDAEKITVIASGAVPAQSSGSTVIVDDADEGMSLTDILLIVLVVLIVIMAIIVALRMMRS